MNKEASPIKAAGRALAALAMPTMDTAYCSAVSAVARAYDEESRLRFMGSTVLAREAHQHALAVVVPAVDAIIRRLGLPLVSWDITLEDLEAASAHDAPVEISGHSAELALFVALLSSAARLPLRQDAVLTGALLSAAGDIGMVDALAAKLRAAMKRRDLALFIYPFHGRDHSMDALAPAEAEAFELARVESLGVLRTAPVRGVDALLRLMADDRDVAMASLRSGYWAVPSPSPICNETPADAAARYLLEGNPERFWRALFQLADARHEAHRRELLEAFLGHYAAAKQYPSGAGVRLLHWINALPQVLRHAWRFPLVAPSLCHAVCGYARNEDGDDAIAMLQANLGKVAGLSRPSPEPPARASEETEADTLAEHALDAVMLQLSREYIARTISAPIENALGAFPLGRPATDDEEEFDEAITPFYLDLLLHTGVACANIDPTAAQTQACALAERAFAGQGGIAAARVEAAHPQHGGLRHVLENMAKTYQKEAVFEHVLLVFETAMSEPDKAKKRALARTLHRRLWPFLPPDIRTRPLEWFMANWRTIAQVYVQSMEMLKDALT